MATQIKNLINQYSIAVLLPGFHAENALPAVVIKRLIIQLKYVEINDHKTVTNWCLRGRMERDFVDERCERRMDSNFLIRMPP